MPAIPVRAQEDIIRAGRRMDQRGWVPATAGNISVRFGSGRIAITRSGVHKGVLNAFSVIEVDAGGSALNPADRPSAETLLHCQLYRHFPDIGAVVHGHSVAGTVLSMAVPGEEIVFAGYELQKAFGIGTHRTSLTIRLFDNDQDMVRLAGAIGPHLAETTPAYYIRGHGIYVWGRDIDDALVRLEAAEFLLECELARHRLPSVASEIAR